MLTQENVVSTPPLPAPPPPPRRRTCKEPVVLLSHMPLHRLMTAGQPHSQHTAGDWPQMQDSVPAPSRGQHPQTSGGHRPRPARGQHPPNLWGTLSPPRKGTAPPDLWGTLSPPRKGTAPPNLRGTAPLPPGDSTRKPLGDSAPTPQADSTRAGLTHPRVGAGPPQPRARSPRGPRPWTCRPANPAFGAHSPARWAAGHAVAAGRAAPGSEEAAAGFTARTPRGPVYTRDRRPVPPPTGSAPAPRL